jgi:hypothetical protein
MRGYSTYHCYWCLLVEGSLARSARLARLVIMVTNKTPRTQIQNTGSVYSSSMNMQGGTHARLETVRDPHVQGTQPDLRTGVPNIATDKGARSVLARQLGRHV